MSEQAKVEEDLEQASEFQRRRNMARVEARIIVSDRSYDVFLRVDQSCLTGLFRARQVRRAKESMQPLAALRAPSSSQTS